MVQNVRKMHFRLKNMPAKSLTKIFNTMVEPGLTYGCEIWGVDFERKQLNSVGASFCKEILGVGRQAASCAALVEVGTILTSAKVLRRIITFFCKTYRSNKVLQRKCLKYQLEAKDPNYWGCKVFALMKTLGIGDIHRSEFTKNTRALIKKTVEKREWGYLFGEVCNMSSLRFYKMLRHPEGDAEYVYTLGRDKRRILARFRLGTYIWQAKKRADGTRECFLCGGSESAEHLLIDCNGLSTARDEFLFSYRLMTAVEIVNLHTEMDLTNMVNFLNKMFLERDKNMV